MRYHRVALAGLIPAALGVVGCGSGAAGDRPQTEYATKAELDQLRAELQTTSSALAQLWAATDTLARLANDGMIDTIGPPKCRPPKCGYKFPQYRVEIEH
jgi:hypothetical protein